MRGISTPCSHPLSNSKAQPMARPTIYLPDYLSLSASMSVSVYLCTYLSFPRAVHISHVSFPPIYCIKLSTSVPLPTHPPIQKLQLWDCLQNWQAELLTSWENTVATVPAKKEPQETLLKDLQFGIRNAVLLLQLFNIRWQDCDSSVFRLHCTVHLIFSITQPYGFDLFHGLCAFGIFWLQQRIPQPFTTKERAPLLSPFLVPSCNVCFHTGSILFPLQSKLKSTSLLWPGLRSFTAEL